jgi:hypothetical protein
MKAKLINYLQFTIIILIASGCLVQFCQVRKQRKRADDFEKLYLSCRDAPVTIDTVNDTIYIHGQSTVITKPVPVKIIVHDTVWVQKQEAWYDSTYSGEGWRFRWRAYCLGELQEIGFSDFVIPRQSIYITKTVDTCLLKLPEKIDRSHLWLYGSPSACLSPIGINSLTAGMVYTRKDKWGIGGGVGYDWTAGKPTGEVLFLVRLK